MDSLAVFGLLLLGVVVLTPVADRIGVPQPVLLTIYGLVLGVVPFVPSPDLPPELILPIVLPPLLFATTQSTSLRELRSAARPILGLAVGLTLGGRGAPSPRRRTAGGSLPSPPGRGCAAREAVLEARRQGEVSPAAADDVLFDVEARALRYES
ncbi:cation:proton antiporter domain-containing protein [Modestobacter sp. SYSU DS0511]